MKRTLATIAGVCVLILAGCDTAPASNSSTAPEPIPEPIPKPIRELAPGTKDAVLDAWAVRTAGLERLWARVTVVVNTVDAQGEPAREQAEGHLQIDQPRRVALTLGKLGETYLYLGSNDERYWWLDTIDRDRRVAITGRHDLVTSGKVARLGVPVHPLGLIELLGISPLSPGITVAPGATAGEIEVRRDLGDGSVTWTVDDERFEPIRVEVLDAVGQRVLAAEHEAYGFARVRDDLAARPRVAGRVIVDVPGVPATVRLALYEPENRDIKPIAFDYDRLVRAFRIDVIDDLDATDSRADSAVDPATTGAGR